MYVLFFSILKKTARERVIKQCLFCLVLCFQLTFLLSFDKIPGFTTPLQALTFLVLLLYSSFISLALQLLMTAECIQHNFLVQLTADNR